MNAKNIISTEPSEDPSVRRAVRVLHMVHELHKAGYQLLRIVPGMSGSGLHYRIAITPATNVCRNHGAYFADETKPDFVARYTSADENEYFGWKDAKNNSARALAAKFIERFPGIAAAGCGSDWPYAGWFVEMLGYAEREEFPVAYSDNFGVPRKGFLPTTRHPLNSAMPLPPAGTSNVEVKMDYL